MIRDERTESAPVTVDEAAPLLAPYLSTAARRTTGVVLAVSGGPDSVALMRLAAQVRAQAPSVPGYAATVDHRLRPQSRTEAEAVACWAEASGFPHTILTWEAGAPRARLQETARDARYGLLAAKARELCASHVLVAHTLDDQAETVLMRMARGTGIAGLGGMRAEVERNGVVLARPFLGLRKERLLATCQTESWPYFDDPSNEDPRFARARMRRTVLPLLRNEGLTPERLAALARRAQRAEEALSARAEAVLAVVRMGASSGRMEIAGAPLLGEPEAIFLRVVARAIVSVAGTGARPVRLERFETHVLGKLRPALDAGTPFRLTLGGALIEVRANRVLVVGPEPPRRPKALKQT